MDSSFFFRNIYRSYNERRVNNMLITMFLFSVAIGCVIGFGVKRHQMNKMTKQMLQLENQKRLLQTRCIVNLPSEMNEES